MITINVLFSIDVRRPVIIVTVTVMMMMTMKRSFTGQKWR